MYSKVILVFCYLVFLGCVSSNSSVYESYEKSGIISNFDSSEIRLRHLDSINAIRLERGLAELNISPELNASADTHARDIAVQKRAWNFGSDYSSPLNRALVSGFNGSIRGENVSETFEGEFSILQVWLNHELSRLVILDPKLTHLGLGWHQEESGKIWWVQDLGQHKK